MVDPILKSVQQTPTGRTFHYEIPYGSESFTVDILLENHEREYVLSVPLDIEGGGPRARLSSSEIAMLVTATQAHGSFEKKPVRVRFEGEPLTSVVAFVNALIDLAQQSGHTGFSYSFETVTALPHRDLDAFWLLMQQVATRHLRLKVALTLDNPVSTERRQQMPDSASIATSLDALREYRKLTDNGIEIQYTLRDGINDSPRHAFQIRYLFDKGKIPFRLLATELDLQTRRHWIDEFANSLRAVNIPVEIGRAAAAPPPPPAPVQPVRLAKVIPFRKGLRNVSPAT